MKTTSIILFGKRWIQHIYFVFGAYVAWNQRPMYSQGKAAFQEADLRTPVRARYNILKTRGRAYLEFPKITDFGLSFILQKRSWR